MTAHNPLGTPLRSIPGVGPATEGDLKYLGYHSVEELRGADPLTLYERMDAVQRPNLDRCVLYVFRCAVYYAETADPQPELLKWWNWKDRVHPRESRP